MPLSRAALYAQGEDLHVALWPGNRRNTADTTRFLAREGRSDVNEIPFEVALITHGARARTAGEDERSAGEAEDGAAGAGAALAGSLGPVAGSLGPVEGAGVVCSPLSALRVAPVRAPALPREGLAAAGACFSRRVRRSAARLALGGPCMEATWAAMLLAGVAPEPSRGAGALLPEPDPAASSEPFAVGAPLPEAAGSPLPEPAPEPLPEPDPEPEPLAEPAAAPPAPLKDTTVVTVPLASVPAAPVDTLPFTSTF
jgi:hypothetical protein